MFIFSIYDKKGCFHVSQFFARSRSEAVRQFFRLANDSQSDVNMFPDEFALYCNGEFDSDTGIVSVYNPINFIVDASALIKIKAEKVEG